MFGFGIVGAFLFLAAAHLPISDALYCYLCPPKLVRNECKFVGVCHTQCLYLLAQEYGRDSYQDWTCRELVPGEWASVPFNNEWIGTHEGQLISERYYPEKTKNGWLYIHSAYACDRDYCNDKVRDSDPIHIGRGNGTTNFAIATVQLEQKWVVCSALYLALFPLINKLSQ